VGYALCSLQGLCQPVNNGILNFSGAFIDFTCLYCTKYTPLKGADENLSAKSGL
jgi:hypothetical protein